MTTSNLAKEAKEFTKKTTTKKTPQYTLEHMIVASILGGLIASGSNRPEEALEEAYRYAKLVRDFE
ncbi:MAG: hypothetical protein COA78_20355 [Blastopirellula sp.]|nr:MAG: hypothetical protein COA78_20355 [Blastopirellula sp.]